jgi:hypothetical protein
MTRAEIEEIAKVAAQAAAREALLGLGVDSSDPNQVRDARNALAWAHQTRCGTNTIKKAAWRTLVGAIVSAILFALWQAFG